MHFFEFYYENIIKYDLINKFKYKDISKLPQLRAIVLNFGCKHLSFKFLLTNLLALELITSKKGVFTVSNKTNLIFKIKKGSVVGCKLVLRKKTMYIFLAKLLNDILPKSKNFTGFVLKSNKQTKSVSYKLQNPLFFLELESNYYLFNKLPELDITFLTDSVSTDELMFLLNSFKLPTIKQCKCNSIGRV